MSEADLDRIRFTSSPDNKDWTSAYFLIIRDRWIWRRLCITFLVLWLFYFALVLGIDVMDYGWHPDHLAAKLIAASGWAGLVAAALILVTVLLTPRRVRKVVEDSARLAPETQFEASGLGLHTSNAVSTTTLVWPQFQRRLENSRVIILMVTRGSFFIIRKSELEPGVCEKLRALLVAAEVPTR
ncbi:YcxB family protein [Novosphingobium sp.]|uniref:YcxB family protein n=1 Tax=Novosphingobium sp. TaxID=1874826 RepID=UPI003BADA0FD